MEDLPDATHEPVPAGTEVPLWEQVAANAVTPTEPYEFCGVPVVVRGLSVGQRLEHVEARRAGADPTSRQIYVEMISRCVIDPATDQAAFTVEQVEHLLDHAPAAEVEDLMRACNRLAGFTSDDEDDAGKRFPGPD